MLKKKKKLNQLMKMNNMGMMTLIKNKMRLVKKLSKSYEKPYNYIFYKYKKSYYMT